MEAHERVKETFSLLWRYERALAERWYHDLKRAFAVHIVGRLVTILVSVAGCVVIGASIRGLAGALVGVLILALVLVLWLRSTAQARMHAEQRAEIAELNSSKESTGTTTRVPKVRFRALSDHGPYSKGDFFGVPHSEVEEVIQSKWAERVTPRKAATYVLDAVGEVCFLISQFELDPPQQSEYYPHGQTLRDRWGSALKELGECIPIAIALDESNQFADYAPVQLWLELLEQETAGEGRLYQYLDRALHLRRWASECKESIQSKSP